MSDCRDLEPMLAPYVDGDVEPAMRERVDQHLGRCPPCRDRVATERTARQVLTARREGLRGCATEHLRRRCLAQRALAGPARASGGAGVMRTLVPLTIAASLLVFIGALFFFGLNRGVELLAAQFAVDHVKCHQFTSDRPEHPDPRLLAQQWKQERGWSLEIPASAAEYDLQLLEVRRCATTEGQNAHILYKWHGAPLSLYVMQTQSDRSGADATFVTTAGQDAVIWNEAGRTYAVVGRANRRDLDQIVNYVKLSARAR